MFQYYYLLGFGLSAFCIPVLTRLLKFLIKVDIKKFRSFTPVLAFFVIASGMITAPHFQLDEMLIVLPLIWFMVIFLLLEEYFGYSSRKIGCIVLLLSVVLLLKNGLDESSYYLALAIFIIFAASVLFNSSKERFIEKYLNPFILFAVFSTTNYNNLGILSFFILKSFLLLNFITLLYLFYNKKKHYVDKNFLMMKLSFLSKYYILGWWLTLINLTPHVLTR